MENVYQIAAEMEIVKMAHANAKRDLLEMLASINFVCPICKMRQDHAKFLLNFKLKIVKNKNRGLCVNQRCQCTKHTHGDYCQELILDPVWDYVITDESKNFEPRASHKSVLLGNELWIYGGLMLNARQMSKEFVVYQVDKKQFKLIKSQNDSPMPRYDHSMITYEVF